MEFIKEKNYFIARGKNGFFKIKKFGGKFYCSYSGKDKVFMLPPRTKLTEVKMLAKENFYWEGVTCQK